MSFLITNATEVIKKIKGIKILKYIYIYCFDEVNLHNVWNIFFLVLAW